MTFIKPYIKNFLSTQMITKKVGYRHYLLGQRLYIYNHMFQQVLFPRMLLFFLFIAKKYVKKKHSLYVINSLQVLLYLIKLDGVFLRYNISVSYHIQKYQIYIKKKLQRKKNAM